MPVVSLARFRPQGVPSVISFDETATRSVIPSSREKMTTLPTPNKQTASSTLAGVPHCPYRRTTDLLQRLAPSKMRIGFLLGAGCPLSIQVGNDSDRHPLIPDIGGLTQIVRDHLTSQEKLKDSVQRVWDKVAARKVSSPTIEDVLSHIRSLKALCGSEVDGFTSQDLGALDREICKQVREVANQSLPNSDSPYHVLASWIQAIPRERPVEIFTTNYDLLIEQALEDRHVPYFDGFIGSDNAFLDLESMAEDDLPARWARLWKIHGSINWWMTEKDEIRRSRDSKEGEQLLIYPSHLKYEQSRQMPYSAMLDRLRVFFRSEQCVLVTCGYSFGDDHINHCIAQGLSGNANASCFGMIYGDRANAQSAIKLAQRHANLTLLAADGGVVGTVSARWDKIVKDANPAYPIAVSTELSGARTKAPADQCKWLLGDFDSLGRFLAHQLSSRVVEQGASNEG
jgi:hypothetical protein